MLVDSRSVVVVVLQFDVPATAIYSAALLCHFRPMECHIVGCICSVVLQLSNHVADDTDEGLP